jgi:hypothetical protein
VLINNIKLEGLALAVVLLFLTLTTLVVRAEAKEAILKIGEPFGRAFEQEACCESLQA